MFTCPLLWKQTCNWEEGMFSYFFFWYCFLQKHLNVSVKTFTGLTFWQLSFVTVVLVISTKVFSVFNFLFFPFVSKAIQHLTMQLCVRCFSKCSLWETQVSTLGTLSIAARVAKVLSEIHTVVSRCVVFDAGSPPCVVVCECRALSGSRLTTVHCCCLVIE